MFVNEGTVDGQKRESTNEFGREKKGVGKKRGREGRVVSYGWIEAATLNSRSAWKVFGTPDWIDNAAIHRDRE